eukprot:GFUD01006289.1.p1 GENE.GFUD01006289.1~~GFUD01006289.1.p1  ORF type:complete len:218 (+),score=38.99 GFUD01006289.1:65-718(+)
MAPSRSRSISREKDEDSVKRTSADRNRSATRSKSKSSPKSKSRSRSKKASLKRSTSQRRSRSRKRSISRRRRSGSHRRSRSRNRERAHPRSRSRSRSPKRSPENDDGFRLHVADLDEECRKADLEEVFMKYGALKEIWLASYAPYYAFVVYRDRMDAQDACEGADGTRIAGRRLRVSLAKPRHKGPRERFVPHGYKGDRSGDYRSGDRGYSRHSSRY